MNKLAINIILILLISLTSVFAQVRFNNAGNIENAGTLRIKYGLVQGFPDTIGGRVEFTQKYEASQQSIPNIVYNQLVLKNASQKIVQDEKDPTGKVKPIVVLDSLIIADTGNLTTRWIGWNPEDIIARNAVYNTGKYTGPKDVRLQNETHAQDLIGNGDFSNLNIDNPFGVNVRGGGFRVSEKLTLTRGELRNDSLNNFNMGDTTWIVRHGGASLSYPPHFEGTVSVRYEGQGVPIVTGPEIPQDSSRLQDLIVANNAGIILDKDVTANNSLYLEGPINTEPSRDIKHSLTYTSTSEPQFVGSEAQIIGTFRRKNLKVDEIMFFNNAYTYAYFADSSSLNGTKTLVFTIRPKTFPPFPDGNLKVQRSYALYALDTNNNLIQSGVNATLGYGWRRTPFDTAKDESNNTVFEELKFQRYIDNEWFVYNNSTTPQWDTLNGWAYATVSGITPYGDFAVGMPIYQRILLASRVFLEGAYRGGTMATDLKEKNLIPLTPPDIYPYNIDPNRTNYFVLSIPDSIVDWIVIELRKDFTGVGEKYYRTGFLKSNGEIVDLDGKSPLRFSEDVPNDDYYVIVHHRNHLAIITEDPLRIIQQKEPTKIDFTDYRLLAGKSNSLKPLDKLNDNTLLYGMIAGDINGDGIIDKVDYLSVWNVIYNVDNPVNNQLDYTSWDINLSGILNTRDWNYTWNNRGRTSSVVK